MPCASGQRIQHERCQWLNSGADQRDRARVLNTHRDMGDVGRGKDRLSWVDHPLSGRHVSTELQDPRSQAEMIWSRLDTAIASVRVLFEPVGGMDLALG